MKSEPVRLTMCETCPFRPGSKYADLAGTLAESAKNNSRICHQTGPANAITKRTGKPAHLCRGARDLQLAQMSACGVISAATDEAWNEARVNRGWEPQIIKDP